MTASTSGMDRCFFLKIKAALVEIWIFFLTCRLLERAGKQKMNNFQDLRRKIYILLFW